MALDLFTPIVDVKDLHPNLKAVLIEPDDFLQKVILSWADGFEDRDNKFVREFQTTFNSSFWELYLFACLKELGFKIDFTFPAPDFVANRTDCALCVEATIANSTADEPEEWQRKGTREEIEGLNPNTIVDTATIRLANAITSKNKKYENSYSQLDHIKTKPFVLAVAPFEQPYFFLQYTQAIRRVLYAYDTLDYKDMPEENRRIVYGHKYMHSITKPNGSEIPLGYFIKPAMPGVSAVIYSNLATFGKVRALSEDPGEHVFFEIERHNPDQLMSSRQIVDKKDYSETLLEGLHVFHNLHAQNPIDPALFDKPGITQHWIDPDFPIAMPLNNAQEGTLLRRSVLKLVDEESFTKDNKYFDLFCRTNRPSTQ